MRYMRTFAFVVVFALVSAACSDGTTTTTVTVTTTTIPPSTTSSTSTTTVPPTTTTEATTTTTVPIWKITPQWCDQTALPGRFVAEDVLGDIEDEFSTYAFIFVRVLEVLGYEEISFESDNFGWVNMKFPVIRASVFEDGETSVESEFALGYGQIVSFEPPIVQVGIEATRLTSRRVPFDDCATSQSERDSLMDRFLSTSAESILADGIELGSVYPVAILVDRECPFADAPLCEWELPRASYGGALFDALSVGNTAELAALQGMGVIHRVFFPFGWYDFGDE